MQEERRTSRYELYGFIELLNFVCLPQMLWKNGKSGQKDSHTVTAPDWPMGDAVESKLIRGLAASVASICSLVCPGAKNGDTVYRAWL